MTTDANTNLEMLNETLGKISKESQIILDMLSDFLEKNKELIPETVLVDIRKIEASSLRLKEEAAKFSAEKFSEHTDLTAYLSKVRHDLYNRINAVQGYSELVLEEFEASNSPFIELFKKMGTIVHCIMKMIDSLRLSNASLTVKIMSAAQSSLQAVPENKKSVPNIYDIEEEFRQFKSKFSILVVDDNEDNCLLLERYLNRIGFSNIQIAHNGYQALAMKNRADLMLLDIEMPEMSGIDVMTNIKEDIIQGRIMVLIISAADTMKNTIECIKFGAEDFLSKPFNADLLQVRINTCIEKKWAIIQQNTYREKLKFEKQRYEKLLHAVFPSVVVEELAQKGSVQAAYYKNVAVLFADIVSFTHYCDTHDPSEIITNLQEFAGLCESIAIKNKVQKIKTIGDCFLGVSGMLTISDNPVLDCINFSEELIASLDQLPAQWKIRIGINFGTVIGGIVGHRQYLFDIWGDTINTTSRIQTMSELNKIYLSKAAWEQVKDKIRSESLGMHEFKGKQPMEVFSYEGKL